MVKKVDKGRGKKPMERVERVERVGIKTVTPLGDFGKYIQSILDSKGFSQTEVARRGGLDSGNITNMIGGSKRNPEYQTIRKLAAGLEEPFLRVCAALLDKAEQRPKEYWFDARLMLIDDLLAQVPAIERVKVDALIKALQSSLMEAYRTEVGKKGKEEEKVINS